MRLDLETQRFIQVWETLETCLLLEIKTSLFAKINLFKSVPATEPFSRLKHFQQLYVL